MSSFYFTPENIALLRPLILNMIKEEMGKLSETYSRLAKREEKANYVSLTEACKLLNISRQTLHNWEKGQFVSIDIKPFILKIGKRKLYDVDSIKWVFKSKNANY